MSDTMAKNLEGKEPLVYTVKDVARILRLSERKVWDLIQNEELKAYRYGGSVRIREEDLEEYMTSTPYEPRRA